MTDDARVVEIPQGWKLVPIEPTPEMVNAGAKFSLTMTDAYKDMVRAAPDVPSNERSPTEFSAHPASGNAGVKLTPAETVRYDPAPECKGVIAARERLEPEGSPEGIGPMAELTKRDAQNDVTAGETASPPVGRCRECDADVEREFPDEDPPKVCRRCREASSGEPL